MNLTQATNEIVRLHNGIITSSRRSVEDAIKIGQIISEQKKLLNHGEFLPWIETLPFSQKTSWNYLKMYDYKLVNVTNLQEAYNKVKQLEHQEKQTEQERKRQLISEYRKTGIKPDSWDRALDYEYEKQEKERIKREEEIARQEDERKKRANERAERDHAEDLFHETLFNATDEIINESKKRNEWKEKIRLSDSGKEDAFQNAIIDYLETLENDNRKIEACQNIIKICRNISVKLQRKE